MSSKKVNVLDNIPYTKEIKNARCQIDRGERSKQIKYKEKINKQKSIPSDIQSKNNNDCSTKSFRIRNNTVSLVKNKSPKSLKNNVILQIINKISNKKKEEATRMRRFSYEKQKQYHPTTISILKHEIIKKKASKEAEQQKPQPKKKCQLFRRTKFEKYKNQNDKSKNTRTIAAQIYNYGHSETNSYLNKKQEQRKQLYKMHLAEKKKFRKGKYQLYSSQSTSYEINNINKQSKSQNYLEIQRKQQYTHISQQNNIINQKLMEYSSDEINKQLASQLEKCCQQYFEQQNIYAREKYQNDIEFLINTIKAPTISQFQTNFSNLISDQKLGDSRQKNGRSQVDLLTYDFDFQNSQSQLLGNCIPSSSLGEQNLELLQQNSFEEQRKIAERDHFLKKITHLNWSQSDCQIDQS